MNNSTTRDYLKGSFQMRRLICAVAFITTAGPALGAQEVDDDGSYRMLLSAGVGRFTGNYGQPEDTTLDVLSLNARWYLKRAELQISLPYLRVDGAADVRWIDGQPVAIGEGLIPDEQRKESGLGDVVLRGEYYLRTGTSTSPWIIGLVRVKLPTGSEAKGLGSGATDVETGIGLIQRHGPISWLADIGYIFVGNSAGLDAKNELRLGAGASVPFGNEQRSSSYVYFENRTHRFDGPDRRSIAVGASTSLGSAKRLRLSASMFFGLSDASEDVGLYLTAGRRY
jgi:hypothetical protein